MVSCLSILNAMDKAYVHIFTISDCGYTEFICMAAVFDVSCNSVSMKLGSGRLSSSTICQQHR